MPGKSHVLDVGNCNPDHYQILSMLERNFDVTVDRVMFVDEAISKMRERQYDLVLFNRLIFDDQSEGLQLVHRARGDTSVHPAPMMMVSNFAEHQAAAVEAGAAPGFGKSKLFAPETILRLGEYLHKKA